MVTVSADPRILVQNRLLAALPREEYQRLVPHLEPVSLSRHQVLYEFGEPIRHVYFPNRAMVSFVSTMESGSTVEVGMVGNEGMIGLPVFLGGNTTTNRSVVQIPDSAMRMKADLLKGEFNLGGSLQSLLLRYTQALFTQISQSAACNRFHSIVQRLARWLLTVQDCVKSNSFALTQEFISYMLGVRRSGVTVAASTLQKAELIRYTRGQITILDQSGLKSTSCNCYRIVKDEFDRLLGVKRG